MIILVILAAKLLQPMSRKTPKPSQSRDESAVYFNNAKDIQHVQ